MFTTRKAQYIRGKALTNRIYGLQEVHKWSSQDVNIALSVLDDALPIALHNVAFEPVFRLQASPELLSKYASAITSRAILGCYLQTELAHGTNVNCLETTATYTPETCEFNLHSPTLTSTKWWIGALGKTATHGVVQAKVILPGGKDMGPHLFFIQLRSLGKR
ncbi:acyl-CoA dehydrogenase/oxidase [Mycena maculata]|uniref:Acyl-CoA dehydrogenase/oxidase n=1 Tax=Mycena maculata TaxID=230809 RepID=A0AAD7KHH7_9AGAR|nr:acyl-CoA dehydrogenase/oxidase [Mycena maculata]